MLRFLTLLFAFISCNARWRQRTRNRCFFRKAGKSIRFASSETTFFIRNTFLQVETTLTAAPATRPWWSCNNWRSRRTVSGFFRYWLPTKAIVSSLRLKVRQCDGQETWYNGYVTTNAQARADFRSKFGNGAQLMFRWTNEQFAMVNLRARMKKADIIAIAIGWDYAIELDNDRYQFYFPVPLPGANADSLISIRGTIVEDAIPINQVLVQSPGPMDLGHNFIIAPVCERIVNDTYTVPCDTRLDVNRVDVSFSARYDQYRYWLSKKKRYRYPWWQYYFNQLQCNQAHKVRNRNSKSSSSAYYRGRNNLRKAVYGANIAHDLVFSMSYNHTLPPFNAIFNSGTEPFYAGPFTDFDGAVNFVFGGGNDSCWLIGVSADEINDAEQIPPALRRATFFVDDNTGVTAEYYQKVKLALIRVLTLAGTDRRNPFIEQSQKNDTRVFDAFRIVVLSGNRQIYRYPTVPDSQLDKFATRNPDTIAAATAFINALPDPPPCQLHPGFNFLQTQNEFLQVMQEYIDLAVTLGQGRNESSDIFLFSNSKPDVTNGNFIKSARDRFVRRIAAKQSALRAFTTRVYGQPIFAFGFGPDADFNLLDAITANNWGAVTMAFEDDSAETIDLQAEQFFRGIGRIIMSRVQISNVQALYGPSFTSALFPTEVIDVNSSLTDAGFFIPVLRDSQYTMNFVQAPPEFNGQRLQGFRWVQDYIPGGALYRVNRQVNVLSQSLDNLTVARIQQPGDGSINFFGRITDKQNLSAVFDESISLCKYGNVVRVHNLEQALRTKKLYPEDVFKTEAEINALIEKAGIAGGLQTSQTAFVVKDIGELASTSAGDNQAYRNTNTDSAIRYDIRLGVFVTMIVFSIVFY